VTHARSDNTSGVLYMIWTLQAHQRHARSAGDVLLRHAAGHPRAVRDIDIVARLGGDEFTVVLTG